MYGQKLKLKVLLKGNSSVARLKFRGMHNNSLTLRSTNPRLRKQNSTLLH